MADRWGYRAKESVEQLDVIAQQTAEGKGPILALQQQEMEQEGYQELADRQQDVEDRTRELMNRVKEL